jgi:hypothetical protein
MTADQVTHMPHLITHSISWHTWFLKGIVGGEFISAGLFHTFKIASGKEMMKEEKKQIKRKKR